MNEKILIVEDDLQVAKDVQEAFGELGLEVEHTANGSDGLARALSNDYALVLLDIMLPGKNGLDVCRELRTAKPLVQIILFTTRSSEVDRVLGFELGADDYVVKPFSMSELLARVRSKLRRQTQTAGALAPSHNEPGSTVSIGQLTLDLERRVLFKAGETIKLTAKEFDLLSWLMHRPGRVFSKFDLLESVWDVDVVGYEAAVVSMIRRLRLKIETDPENPEYILNSRGMGYSFVEPENIVKR